VKLIITPGQTHDIQAAAELLSDIRKGQMVLADRAYDADWLRDLVFERGGWANIPPKANRKSPICFSPWPNSLASGYDCAIMSPRPNITRSAAFTVGPTNSAPVWTGICWLECS
jgi:hypothetical protein